MTDPRPDVGAVLRWLVDEPHAGDDGAAFMRGLAACLIAAGLPLARISLALMTMHPEVLWRTVQWRAGRDVRVHDQPHARQSDPYYTRSAVAAVRRTAGPVRVRLLPGDLPYPICHDLRAEGATDYYVQALPFTTGQVSYVSFATDEPAGFSTGSIAALEQLRLPLARRLELESSYYATRALLAVYLGANAARRVLAGQFQRGRGELVDAVIWFSDMRGFTALADRTSPARVVEVLDAHFDAIASAVAEHDGEILKFIGDAVLAVFPVGDDAGAACRRALAAATSAFARLAQLADREHLEIGLALHRGVVMYGNIGARDRLDFTVISAAVNEASRLESLCKTLGTPLLLSAAFVEAAGHAVHAFHADLVDLGEHSLRGVSAPVRVFTPR